MIATNRALCSAHQLQKMPPHARCVGGEAGEVVEGADRLVHGHAAAVEGATAPAAGEAQEFGVEREVDDLGDPQMGIDEFGGAVNQRTACVRSRGTPRPV